MYSKTHDTYMKYFLFQNALVCVIFAISLLAGGIANAVYAADNSDHHFDLCASTFRSDIEDCEHLETVYQSEAAATVSVLVMMCATYSYSSSRCSHW